jgi:cobalamin 5'-phosphate synthase/cobalamin synthase
MSDSDAQRDSFAPDHPWDDAGQWLGDCRRSLGFLTRLPIDRHTPLPPPALAGAMRAFPVAGLVVGLIVGATLVLAAWLGAPASVAALIAVGAGLGLTGALHEDGLADVADGFGGGATRERKLEIMRDSRIGTYGVLALILAVALKAVVLAALAAQSVWLAFAVIVAAAAVSRVAPAGMMHLLTPARDDGLSADAGPAGTPDGDTGGRARDADQRGGPVAGLVADGPLRRAPVGAGGAAARHVRRPGADRRPDRRRGRRRPGRERTRHPHRRRDGPDSIKLSRRHSPSVCATRVS